MKNSFHTVVAVVCSLLATVAIGYLVSNMPKKYVPPTYADALYRAMVIHGDTDNDSFFTIKEEAILKQGFLYYLIEEKNIMVYSLDYNKENILLSSSIFVNKITGQKINLETLIGYLFEYTDWLTIKKNPSIIQSILWS